MQAFVRPEDQPPLGPGRPAVGGSAGVRADIHEFLLAVDADGGASIFWPVRDAKLRWPQVEALYATLLAYRFCRENWCLEWHRRVREYCWAHDPVPVHGEWRQRLARQGRPLAAAITVPVKDPFDLPRTLILCVQVLGEFTVSPRSQQ